MLLNGESVPSANGNPYREHLIAALLNFEPHMYVAKRILIADDTPTVRKMLCQLFEREDDYVVCSEARNGQEAVEMALKERPDLIILDMAMPILNGLSAARKLKKLMPTVPIILFTQHDIELVRSRIEVVADRVVPKSEAIDLMTHVRALL